MPNGKPNTSLEIGALTSFSKIKGGVQGISTKAQFKVLFYSDSITRIVITQNEAQPDFSYAVVGSPREVEVDIEESPEYLILNTVKIKLVIQKNPVRFSFQTLDSRVINEDDPGLGTSWIGEQATTYKKLQEGERFIGLGEKTGPLDRRGNAYQNWNTDAYGYHGGSDPLYCSTPFYMGLHHQLVYGIFFDNTHKTFFNFGASNNRFSSFSSDSGEMNYYFMSGESVSEIIEQYTWLTGRMEMPPLWSIGYQQCRYSYYPDKEVLSLARTFHEKDIPADVIVLDIHYMDKYKIFTWDEINFPDPKGLIDALHKSGFNVVLMCDPGIKEEPGYKAYEDGVDSDVFLKYPDGKYYTGQVWPGWCHFPDFTNPKTRAWWKEQLKQYTRLGVKGYWNDMNEIATWGHALPENLEFDFDGHGGTTRKGRNVFGFQMARSTYEGTKELLNGQRPFNLTRSAFSGIQRYAAVWTGDNVSYDDHMLLGVRLVNSLGLTGVAFAGYDAGGFVGDANTKLFARWISIAALSPFFRGHTMINTRDSEPWSYGEEVEQIARNVIKFRYQLMPYIYSLYHEAATTGKPVQRSLALDYSFEQKVYDHAYHNQYLFGPSLLVAPVESTKDLMKIYLPEGDWHYLYTGKKYDGNQEIFLECPIHKLPVFVKGGAVLPMKKAGKNTREETEDLILHIYQGKKPSSFVFYEDDGETFGYQKGAFARRVISYHGDENRLSLLATEGSFKTQYKNLIIAFHGSPVMNVVINGTSSPIESKEFSFFTPLEKYDPINDPEWMGTEGVQLVKGNYQASEITITWKS
jgi:alpha-glucosidase